MENLAVNNIENVLGKIRAFFAEDSLRKHLTALCIILAFTLICETFIFNYKWLTSAFDKEITDFKIDTGSGVRENSDGGYDFTSETGTLEIKGLNQELNYIRISPGVEEGVVAEVVVSATDESNYSYLSAPRRYIAAEVERSKYLRLHYSGNIENLKLEIKGLEDKSIDAEDIRLNVNVPFMFSWLRFLTLALFLIIIYGVKYARSYIRERLGDSTELAKKIIVVAVIIAQSAMYWNMLQWNTVMRDSYKTSVYNMQYSRLAEAFLDGRLYIEEANDELAELENPYDTSERNAKKVNYKWDHAYHDGKYYVYFGVVPVLILYLPYMLITGQDLPNYVAEFIFGVMIMIGIMMLLREIIKKWFKNTPFYMYIILSSVFTAVSGLVFVIQKPDFYMVPIIAAIMFALFGLAFWISAERTNEEGGSELIPWRLAVGSACMALTVGCRPQVFIAAFAAFPLFWSAVFKKRDLFSRSGVKQTAALCLPFLVVACGIMWYNAARFGSPFDFGANYNLTTNDMTGRGFVAGRTGLGIFTYLLQPPMVNAVFPFIRDFTASTVYQGRTLMESSLGGAIWIFPILLIGVYGLFNRKMFDDKRLYGIIIIMTAGSAALAILDTQMAGLLTRYINDFAWMLMLAAIIAIFALYKSYSGNIKKRTKLENLVLVLSVMTTVNAFLIIFTEIAYSTTIKSANPEVFYSIQHLIAFWM